MKMFNRKGQNIAEYSILIAIVIGAAVAMQVYVKRGIQGKIKDAVDYKSSSISNADGAGTPLSFTTNQYEPNYTETAETIASSRGAHDNVGASGSVNRTGINETTTKETGGYERTSGVP